MKRDERKGKFITLEGGEGSGKSSMVPIVIDCLKDRVEVIGTRDPGAEPISHQIRSILVDAKNKGIDPMTELLLYLAARRQLTQDIIIPALQAGKWVVCDRYSDSTYVYQGFTKLGTYEGHQDGVVTMRNLQVLSDTTGAGIRPDLTLFMDVDPLVGLERARGRASGLPEDKREDRFERKKLAFHEKIREGFQHLAMLESDRIKTIDASQEIYDVAEDVRKAVLAFAESTAA